MSKIEVNTIDSQCGSALQIGCTNTATIGLGKSGDTITITSGATIVNSGTQTGFGRTGTVDWDTSIKTGTVTAVSGSGYFVDTTAGGITVNLPAAAVGSIVAVSDYASTAASNNITISPNGSEKINAVNDVYTISTAGLAVTLVYADATRGWKSVTGSDADAVGVVPAYIAATGGTPCSGAIVCTNYKVHKFTGPGTFCVSAGAGPLGIADYMVVAGGGGSGASHGGGGGAGGFRESPGTSSGCYTTSPRGTAPAVALVITPGAYPITIGAGGGGAPVPLCKQGCNGSNSIFSTITSSGGGGGGGGHPGVYGAPGGSGGGGGGGQTPPTPPNPGGTGNTPPAPVAQGTNGGAGSAPAPPGAGGTAGGTGGGGGATVAATDTTTNIGGVGGAGATTSISATPTAYGGGGGGGGQTAGAAGTGGGGPGTTGAGGGTAGTVNTGGGAGGGGSGGAGALGGSGIIYIRYKFQ